MKVCSGFWKSLAHFDYLHRCSLLEGHSGPCRCKCGKRPGPRGARFPKSGGSGS